jgi:catechol 2,3-dioxygenase-like lactoylglutathione lyase family enzyme
LLRSTLSDVSFDHVAHAVPHWHDMWGRYAIDLGGAWRFHGYGVGFAPAQLRFANEARIEVLMPYEEENNDFLVRFLATNGPGSHHLTFKVPNLETAVGTARQAGFEPIGVRSDDPKWMEAFLHPKDATGILVQLAEVERPLVSSAPDDFPLQRRQRKDGSAAVPPASFLEVVHAVADLQSAVELFVELLGATVVSQEQHHDHRSIRLTWGDPLTLRLIAPLQDQASGPVHDWLRGKSGRVHHLVFETDEPGTIAGARPASADWVGVDPKYATGCWRIEPSENAGLGLLLVPRR